MGQEGFLKAEVVPTQVTTPEAKTLVRPATNANKAHRQEDGGKVNGCMEEVRRKDDERKISEGAEGQEMVGRDSEHGKGNEDEDDEGGLRCGECGLSQDMVTVEDGDDVDGEEGRRATGMPAPRNATQKARE